MAPTYIQEFIPLFQLISRMRYARERKQLLILLAHDYRFRHAVREIMINIQHRTIDMPPAKIAEITKYKKIITRLGKSGKLRRPESIKLVTQSGGLWPLLIPILTTALLEN